MGTFFSTDESQPSPTGHFLPKIYNHLPGTILFIWMLWKSMMVYSMMIGVWTPSVPEALFYMYIPTLILSGGFFILNILYMGSTKRHRKEVLTTERLWDRILRSGTEFWHTAAVLGPSAVTMMFMLIFYNMDGVGTAAFQPLPLSPTGPEFTYFVVVKCFELATLAICALSFLLVIQPISDALKRHIDARMIAAGGGANSGESMNSHAGNDRTIEMSEVKYNAAILDGY